MAVQITISFDELVEAVKRLTVHEKELLKAKLEEGVVEEEKPDPSRLSSEEFSLILDEMVIDVGEMLPTYSDRRQDWYDDDGR
jgi:hypothetical protein